MTNCQVLPVRVIADSRTANSGDVIKISISLVGTGPFDDPSTTVFIQCNFWVKVLDKPPDKIWKKTHGGYLAPIFGVLYKNKEFYKSNKIIKLNGSKKLMQIIEDAMESLQQEKKNDLKTPKHCYGSC
jgi:hypothetical protein